MLSSGGFHKVLSSCVRQNDLLRHIQPLYGVTGKRFLFSHDKLGIENFKRNKAFHFEKMGALKVKFCKEVEEFMEQKEPVVFTADLKTMVHLAEDMQDLRLLEKMIKLYQKQQTDLSFAQFSFGPLVMRFLHMMNQPEEALRLNSDQDLQATGFFDQMSSQLLLLDLLYEDQRYEDVHRVMDIVRSRQLGGVQYPMDCVTLAVAACLKQNTPESYNQMLQYVEGCQKSAQNLSHRAVVQAILLAIKQEKYVEAVEMLSLVPEPSGQRRQPLAVHNIKLLAYVKVGKVEEALLLLRSVLENDVPDHIKTGGDIFREILSEVQATVTSTGDKELLHQYESLERGLLQGNHVTEASFEDYTLRTIIKRRDYQDGYKHKQEARKAQNMRQTLRLH